jgi:hypothetical protein
VDDHLLLEVLDCQRDLPQVVPRLQLGDSLPPLYQLVQSLVGTQLQDYVDVGCVLKGSLVLYHVLRTDRFMDFNFRGQLHGQRDTFSLALERVSVAFSMIFAAYFLPVARLVN